MKIIHTNKKLITVCYIISFYLSVLYIVYMMHLTCVGHIQEMSRNVLEISPIITCPRFSLDAFSLSLCRKCVKRTNFLCTGNIPTVGVISGPLPNESPPLVLFHQSWIYMVSKKHCGKANHSTLASGGSEHA